MTPITQTRGAQVPLRDLILTVLLSITWEPPALSFSDLSSYGTSPKLKAQHTSTPLHHPFSTAQGPSSSVINTQRPRGTDVF